MSELYKALQPTSSSRQFIRTPPCCVPPSERHQLKRVSMSFPMLWCCSPMLPLCSLLLPRCSLKATMLPFPVESGNFRTQVWGIYVYMKFYTTPILLYCLSSHPLAYNSSFQTLGLGGYMLRGIKRLVWSMALVVNAMKSGRKYANGHIISSKIN